MIVSKRKLGHISPMLWISGGFVVVFGGLTVYFHDPKFIQMKPTLVYAMFAVLLGFGLLILVHEAGHFIAAKWANIRTDAYPHRHSDIHAGPYPDFYKNARSFIHTDGHTTAISPCDSHKGGYLDVPRCHPGRSDRRQ